VSTVCRDYRERLDLLEDYLEGRLPASEQAQLSEHLGRCERCAQALAAAQLATQVLREARLLRAPEPSLGFAQRVTARLQAEQQAIADFWHALEVFARRVSWTASVLLLVLGGYLWTLDLPTHQQVGPQETAEVQEIFPEPYQRPANPEEVLLSLTSNGAGR
jgi:anti-sigma factor RsiW